MSSEEEMEFVGGKLPPETDQSSQRPTERDTPASPTPAIRQMEALSLAGREEMSGQLGHRISAPPPLKAVDLPTIEEEEELLREDNIDSDQEKGVRKKRAEKKYEQKLEQVSENEERECKERKERECEEIKERESEGVKENKCGKEKKRENEKKCENKIKTNDDSTIASGSPQQAAKPGSVGSWYDEWLNEQDEKVRERERIVREAMLEQLKKITAPAPSTMITWRRAEPGAIPKNLVPLRRPKEQTKREWQERKEREDNKKEVDEEKKNEDKENKREEKGEMSRLLARIVEKGPRQVLRVSPTPTRLATSNRPEPTFLPIVSEWPDTPMEWDEVIPPALPPRTTEVRRATTQKKKKKKAYNPRRHLERDDYVSSLPTPRHSPVRAPSPMEIVMAIGIADPDTTVPTALPATEPTVAADSGEPSSGRFPMKKRGVLFGGLKLIPVNPRVDPPPYACHNCWQSGHGAAACTRPVTRTYCRNCGRHGVETAACPRCGEAFTQRGGQGTSSNREEERRDEAEREEERKKREREEKAHEQERRRKEDRERERRERERERREIEKREREQERKERKERERERKEEEERERERERRKRREREDRERERREREERERERYREDQRDRERRDERRSYEERRKSRTEGRKEERRREERSEELSRERSRERRTDSSEDESGRVQDVLRVLEHLREISSETREHVLRRVYGPRRNRK